MNWMFRSVGLAFLCGLWLSACGSSPGKSFGEPFCKKGFSCRNDLRADENGKAQFDNYFGINDETFCVKLWVSRLDDPLKHGNSKCGSVTQPQLDACLEAINKTTSCSEIKTVLTAACKLCL
ncbi:hypothetical protein L6R29_25085 [Myxococcota bacterium]|nr:hypothetical protein [Myxococcota bacterium]